MMDKCVVGPLSQVQPFKPSLGLFRTKTPYMRTIALALQSLSIGNFNLQTITGLNMDSSSSQYPTVNKVVSTSTIHQNNDPVLLQITFKPQGVRCWGTRNCIQSDTRSTWSNYLSTWAEKGGSPMTKPTVAPE